MMTPEVCAVLGVSRMTLSRWRESGRLVPDDQVPGPRGEYLYARAKIEQLAAERALAQ